MGIEIREERIGEGFEIQFYQENGSHGRVVAADTAEDLAACLADLCWRQHLGPHFPTV